MSRWFVGSSKIRQFDSFIIIIDSCTRTRSPPDSTFIFFMPSSPENSMRPRNWRTYVTSFTFENCMSQSVIGSSVSKMSLLSFAK